MAQRGFLGGGRPSGIALAADRSAEVADAAQRSAVQPFRRLIAAPTTLANTSPTGIAQQFGHPGWLIDLTSTTLACRTFATLAETCPRSRSQTTWQTLLVATSWPLCPW